jgi:hypothetical protein
MRKPLKKYDFDCAYERDEKEKYEHILQVVNQYHLKDNNFDKMPEL